MEEININVTKNIEEIEINVEPNITQVIITEVNGGGGVESVSGNLVDNTDPNNPIVNGLADVIAGTNITIDKTDPANPIISSSGGGATLQEIFENAAVNGTSIIEFDTDEGTFVQVNFLDPITGVFTFINQDGVFQFYPATNQLAELGIEQIAIRGAGTQTAMIPTGFRGDDSEQNEKFLLMGVGDGSVTIPDLEGEDEIIATREWVTANVSGGAVDSVNNQTGVVVLDASDVGAEPALGFTPENVANKTTDLTSPNNTKYPTSQAVKNYAQPQMMRYLVSSIVTQTNTAATLSINGGNVTSSTGIVAVSPFSATNAKEAISRVAFRTAGTTGAMAFYRTSFNILFLRDDFFIETTILNNSLLSGSRFFFGLSSASAANPTNVAPDSIINQVGFCKPASSNNLHVIHNDNTGTATTIDLGANFSMIDPDGSFYLLLENTPDTGVKYTVVRMNENLNQTHSATGVISTNLPDGTLSLFHRLWITNNDVSDVVELFWRGLTYGKLLN